MRRNARNTRRNTRRKEWNTRRNARRNKLHTRNNKFLKTYQISPKKDQIERKKVRNNFFKMCESIVQMFFAAATSHAATVRTNKNRTTIISQTTTKTHPKTQQTISHSVATHWRINCKTTPISHPNTNTHPI